MPVFVLRIDTPSACDAPGYKDDVGPLFRQMLHTSRKHSGDAMTESAIDNKSSKPCSLSSTPLSTSLPIDNKSAGSSGDGGGSGSGAGQTALSQQFATM